MVERAITDGLVLVEAAATGDVTAAVTAVGTYTDLSPKALTYNISESRANATVNPHGAIPRGRVLAGPITGTIAMTFLRDSDGTPDPEALLEGIHSSHGRLHFVIQDDRSDLTVGGNVTPAASDANPQYAGSAMINGIDYFGPADGTPSVVSVTCDLDRDFARYTS